MSKKQKKSPVKSEKLQNNQPQFVQISTKDAQAIYNYLLTRPYQEVVGGIRILEQAVPVAISPVKTEEKTPSPNQPTQ